MRGERREIRDEREGRSERGEKSYELSYEAGVNPPPVTVTEVTIGNTKIVTSEDKRDQA